jgi:hypothetical protein
MFFSIDIYTLIIIVLVFIIYICFKGECVPCQHAYTPVPKNIRAIKPLIKPKTVRGMYDGTSGNNLKYIDREGSSDNLDYSKPN